MSRSIRFAARKTLSPLLIFNSIPQGKTQTHVTFVPNRGMVQIVLQNAGQTKYVPSVIQEGFDVAIRVSNEALTEGDDMEGTTICASKHMIGKSYNQVREENASKRMSFTIISGPEYDRKNPQNHLTKK